MLRELQRIEHDILDKGKVDSNHLRELREALYGAGPIPRQSADYLVQLYKRVQYHTPAFENFFYRALKDHALTDGRVSAGEAAWLRGILLADGKIQDEERKFLTELKGEAKEVSPEFEALFEEAMAMPIERRTSGSGR